MSILKVARMGHPVLRAKARPLQAAEIERVHNQVTTDAWRGMRDPLDLALRLLVADAQSLVTQNGFATENGLATENGGWRALETWPAEVLQVDAAAVRRVAERYLRQGDRVIVRVTRQGERRGGGR